MQATRLGSLIGILYGKGLPASSRQESGSIPVYGSNGQVGTHNIALTSGETIIIGRKGSIGAIHHSQTKCWPIDTTYYIDQFPSNLYPRYLYWFLKSQDFRHLDRAAAIPGIRRDDLYEISIPLPVETQYAESVDIQRALVARIESLLAELREIRDLHDAIDRDVAQVMDSVFGEKFPSISKPLPDGWKIQSVEELSLKPQYGYTQSANEQPIGPKFLRITDIQDGFVDWETVPYCEISPKDEKKYILESGDIVFARSGATTGKTYLVTNPPRAVFASYLIRLRVRKIVPDYLYWFFQSPDYWRQIVPQGAAQPNMNASLLQQIRVPVPENEDLQHQIVAYLNSVREDLQEMQGIQSEDSALLEQVEQAILEQAFRGEL